MNRFLFACWSAFIGSLLTLTLVGWLAPSEPANAGDAADPISLTTLAEHATATSCWIAVDGVVYDITGYLPMHPTAPGLLLAWCGKEASKGWHTKGYGAEHSAAAMTELKRYRVGELVLP